MSNLTTLEKAALSALLNGDKYDDLHTLHFLDLSDLSKIPTKKLRGVISSLSQKGLVIESALEDSWSLETTA